MFALIVRIRIDTIFYQVFRLPDVTFACIFMACICQNSSLNDAQLHITHAYWEAISMQVSFMVL